MILHDYIKEIAGARIESLFIKPWAFITIAEIINFSYLSTNRMGYLRCEITDGFVVVGTFNAESSIDEREGVIDMLNNNLNVYKLLEM